MGRRAMGTSLAVAVVLISLISQQQQRASAESAVCMSTVMSLAPCLNYLNGKSSSPSEPCCSQFGIVVKGAQAECLCTLFNGEASKYGLAINQTTALSLPDTCHVKTPPLSACPGVSPGAGKSPATATATPSTPSANSPAPAKAKSSSTNAAGPTAKATAPAAGPTAKATAPAAGPTAKPAAAPTTTPTVSDAKSPAAGESQTADKSSDGISYKSAMPMVISAVFFAVVFGSSF